MANNQIIQIGIELARSGSVDDHKPETLIEVLVAFDDLYTNCEDVPITDTQYDYIRGLTERMIPTHKYFTGVGSEVRGGKVKLPFQMGSLNQVHEGEAAKWIAKYAMHKLKISVSDKLDGASATILYDEDGKLQIAYSRGNGIEGADITRHVRTLPTVPSTVPDGPLVVRGEHIISIENFQKAKKVIKRSDGSEYRNPRNMVAGLLNSKTHKNRTGEFVEFVAFEVLRPDNMCKMDQLNYLLDSGFLPVYAETLHGDVINDNILTAHLNTRRERSRFEIDGLVLEVDSAKQRLLMNPTHETLNPAYAVKFKVADESNQAVVTCKYVEWNLSKHGYWKPRVVIEPVDLCNVTIQHATGFNAAFIMNNGIGPGAQLQLTRSGDVIPFIQHVVTPAEPDMPDNMENCKWTVNLIGEKVDLVLENFEDNEEVQIKRMMAFFESIDAPMLREGNIRKLFAEFVNPPVTWSLTIEDVIMLPESEFVRILGENGHKVFNGLQQKLNPIPLYQLIGAHSSERGIGVRKMKKLQQALGLSTLLEYEVTAELIAEQDGFDVTTAEKVVESLDRFWTFWEIVSGCITIEEEVDTSGGSLENEKICMTGFRDKDLAAQVESLGGSIQSGVSSKTTILVTTNPDSTTGKMKKARDLGIRIMSVDEFKNLVTIS